MATPINLTTRPTVRTSMTFTSSESNPSMPTKSANPVTPVQPIAPVVPIAPEFPINPVNPPRCQEGGFALRHVDGTWRCGSGLPPIFLTTYSLPNVPPVTNNYITTPANNTIPIVVGGIALVLIAALLITA